MNQEGDSQGAPDRVLWVCWSLPSALPVEKPKRILSFLLPSAEEELERHSPGCMLRAREVSRDVREHARVLYTELVSRLGTVMVEPGRSFRQALSWPHETSRWWFHPVAFKDCESDPAFNWLIAVLTIQAVAQKYGCQHLVLSGAPPEVAAVLRGAFAVEERGSGQATPAWRLWINGLASRLRYAWRTLRYARATRRQAALSRDPLDVALSGFWDWSVCADDQGVVQDRYFGRLPDELRLAGVRSIGWLAWLDPDRVPGQPARSLSSVLDLLKDRRDVVMLQGFLRPMDIMRAVFDFSPFLLFLKLRNRPAFKEALREEGLDWSPLFAGQLLQGFVNAALPHGELVARAAERAGIRLKPRISVSFLEHFPYSRAFYAGIRRACTGTLCLAVQHASYNGEKTFLHLHRFREFCGEPDGCAVPCPDYVCAMGALGQELFLECGYPKDRVLLTGSPRYDHVALADEVSPKERRAADICLLIAASLSLEVELDMVDGVCAAVLGLPGVTVLLREHPFSRISAYPRFAPYRRLVQVTNGSLQQDLARADVLLFTYSTVADEAYLQGKPVWQWLPTGFDGSALAAVANIPRFSSSAALRLALRDFQADPSRFQPDREDCRVTLERLFYRADGGAASRVAAVVREKLREIHPN